MKKNYFLALVLLCLTACTTPVNPDFLAMSKKYSQILVQYQVDQIATNIIRTSREEPLSFLDMPNINGSGNVSQSVSNSASLSGVSIGQPTLYGGSLTSLSASYSLSWGNSFSFSQASLDNSAFWKAFLQPIKPESISYFLKHNIPIELLFNLTVDAIQIDYPDGSVKKYFNDPLSPQFKEFENEAKKLIGYGITVEEVSAETKTYSQNTRQPKSERPDNFPSNGVDRMPTSADRLPPGGVDGIVTPRTYSSYSTYSSYRESDESSSRTKFRICLGNMTKEAEIVKSYGSEILCHSPNKLKKTLSSSDRLKEPSLRLYIRSTKSVFDYLGEVTYAQTRQKDPFILNVTPSTNRHSKNANQQNENAILVFNVNQPAFDDFASVTISNGNVYTIPRENSGYSTLTINLLAQLVSVVKSPASIPYSPGILIK